MPEGVPRSVPGAAEKAAAQAADPAEAASAGRRTVAPKAKATVLVDLDLCKACGICIALCPTTVFDRDEAGCAVVARQDECTACRLCEWHCPDFAIEVIVAREGAPEGAPNDTTGGALTGAGADPGDG